MSDCIVIIHNTRYYYNVIRKYHSLSVTSIHNYTRNIQTTCVDLIKKTQKKGRVDGACKEWTDVIGGCASLYYQGQINQKKRSELNKFKYVTLGRILCVCVSSTAQTPDLVERLTLRYERDEISKKVKTSEIPPRFSFPRFFFPHT